MIKIMSIKSAKNLFSDLCDGKSDCPDAEDEVNCSCHDPSFSFFTEIIPKISRDVPVDIKQIDMTTFTVLNGSQMSTFQEMPLYAFKRSFPSQALDANALVFHRFKKVVVYIHGYATADLNDGLQIKDALFQGTHDVDLVILLDWRLWSLRKLLLHPITNLRGRFK